MRLIALLLACLCFASTAYAEAIGVFTVTRGQVQVLRGENYLAAAPGVEVQSDDIIETGKAAAAQVDMEDGSVLKLGPETRLALSDYKLDANKNVISATLDVLSGWLRFAVAKLKPTGRYSLNTPVLTIGVRGTEGTIEAENEQGGLHLEEGAVDVAPAGPDLPGVQPIRVNSGEFIQRLRGQPLAKLPQPPPGFQKRLPPVVQEKLTRRAHDLKERGVPPKVIRAITREDAKRILERHPHMQERLRDRFKPLGVKTPGALDKDFAPGQAKDPASDKAKPAAAPSGFGGQILRERQLKTGAPSDPKDVSEALRRRYQQKQQQDKLSDPGLAEKPQPRPGVIVPGAQPPLREKPIVQPGTSPTMDRAPSTLQKPPLELKPQEETPGPTKTPLLRQPSTLIQQPERQTLGK